MHAINNLVRLTIADPTWLPPIVNRIEVNDQQTEVRSAAISPKNMSFIIVPNI